jgi:hypothetical protein
MPNWIQKQSSAPSIRIMIFNFHTVISIYETRYIFYQKFESLEV